MIWEKRGRIHAPSGKLWWEQRYTGIPTIDAVSEERLRIFYFSCVENGDGRTGYVDVSTSDPSEILAYGQEPVLDIGEPGTFDDCGVIPSCIVPVGDKKYMYYVGVQRLEKAPYLYMAGLAISEDGLHYKKLKKTPILERTDDELFLRSATTIIEDNGVLRMWYVASLGWWDMNGKMQPTYVVRHAESKDGINWTATGHTCIDFKDEHEYGFGRPWVIKENDMYRMWYSIRSRKEPYRIGYAESKDGFDWNRIDNEQGLERSPSGWDSEMICYPCVADVGGRRVMFYNGNQHGRDGFGYAQLKSE